jgi:hypothetical protein
MVETCSMIENNIVIQTEFRIIVHKVQGILEDI